jgi:type I site-specific restriction endonuclease
MIEKQSKMKNNYTCIACNKQEPMPNKGFAINNQIAKLITRKPKEIPKGPEAEKLKQNLGDLDDLVNKLISEMENGENSITEDCKEQRRHIQLVKEKKIEEINKHCDALLLQIDVYEEKCKSKCKEMNQAKQKANELIKSVNESIKQLDAYLRQLKIDEKETIEYNQNMDELKTQLEKERINIKNSIFGDQIMKFEASTTPIDEEDIGKLIYYTIEKIYYTVIFLFFNI